MKDILKCPLCGSDKLVRYAEIYIKTKEFIRWNINRCILTGDDETAIWCGDDDCDFKMEYFDGTQESIDNKENHNILEEVENESNRIY
jgi:hypothetical protein